MQKFLLIFILSLYLGTANAAPKPKNMMVSCENTIAYSLHGLFPETNIIFKSNNLRRKSGSPHIAEGIPIIITGRVIDNNCLPVSNAIIEIWQNDSKGNQLQYTKPEEPFAHSGTTYTNNIGEYRFLSIIPATKEPRGTPTIHFKIKHKDLGKFTTRLHFPSRNTSRKLKPQAEYITQVANDKLFRFNITMPGKRAFEKF